MKRAMAILALVALQVQAASETRRDPTQPPPGYGPQKAATARDPLEAVRPEHIVVANGQRYLMWQGRRFGLGDTLQGAKIERIDETEVWLRNDAGLRKLALYPRIEKRPSAAMPAEANKKGPGQ
jgi:hypothetical protein